MSLAEQLADTIPAPAFPKACTCCETVYDAASWAALRLVGTMDDYAGGLLELRDCVCGSTLAVEAER